MYLRKCIKSAVYLGLGKGTWVLPGGSGIRYLIPDLKAYGIWTAVVLANLRDRESYYDKKYYIYIYLTRE